MRTFIRGPIIAFNKAEGNYVYNSCSAGTNGQVAAFTSEGHNIEEGIYNTYGVRPDIGLKWTDPLLGPLQNNGGSSSALTCDTVYDSNLSHLGWPISVTLAYYL
jgi:hypothetical protein